VPCEITVRFLDAVVVVTEVDRLDRMAHSEDLEPEVVLLVALQRESDSYFSPHPAG
jgi:hypothetical protein